MQDLTISNRQNYGIINIKGLKHLKVVFRFTKPYIGLIIFAILLMLVELAVDMYAPILMSQIIENGILNKNTPYVVQYLVIMLVISVVAFIAGIINSYIASHVCHSFSFDLRAAMMDKLQQLSLKSLNHFKTSSIITRLTSDVLSNERLLFMSLRIMLKAPLSIIASIVLSFVIAPQLAWILLVGTPVLFVFLYYIATTGMKYFMRIQKRNDKLNRSIQQNLEGVRLIKSSLSGSYETDLFDQQATPLKNDTMFALRLMETIMPVLIFIMNMALIAIIYVGSDYIQASSLEVGSLVAIINYTLRMQGGFSMFAFIIIAFSSAKASAERISEILTTEVDEVNELISSENVHEKATIEFKNVSFKYPLQQNEVLKNISFKINEGSKFVIMGQTGSGKSALLSLIPRMYDASKGQIFVGGKDVCDWQLKQLRQFIGYVPQKTMLFTGSIAENIKFGDEKATEKAIEEATIQAQIYDSIIRFDESFETKVGQQGVNLSGGQKQRLAIARALIRKPDILILDDSTSALDIHTENHLFNALEQMNMTRIIVTQKIHTAKTADQILLLEHGEINAIGTHEELLETSPLYKSIVQSQEGTS